VDLLRPKKNLLFPLNDSVVDDPSILEGLCDRVSRIVVLSSSFGKHLCEVHDSGSLLLSDEGNSSIGETGSTACSITFLVVPVKGLEPVLLPHPCHFVHENVCSLLKDRFDRYFCHNSIVALVPKLPTLYK